MKKLLCFLVIVLLCASSCAVRTEGDPFVAFGEMFEADVTLKCNGNVSSFRVKTRLDAEKTTFWEIEITSPEQASGYVFTFDGENYKLSFNEISVECNERLSVYPEIVKTLLSPSRDAVTSIGTEKSGEQLFSVVKTADVKYMFSSDGVPFSASGIACGHSVELNFNSFSVESPSAQ